MVVANGWSINTSNLFLSSYFVYTVLLIVAITIKNTSNTVISVNI